ncbi:NADH-quinone oxidoreductase subunit N [Gilliamella sp. Pas-s95]|uniref:NADH-quinone oxidoreductase subunit N n=1 Tax=Gilliamella sp. Pas-s95 TaxID=2687317 RepID=UPI001328FDEE|nr:NADH-quinone oxidoreductase subunit N [Gilliamella sp. Pas-s95]MWN05875.1 NADH-quinone oxidoreductase subunit NuoN [Gilliamella sp. Pas-s95]
MIALSPIFVLSFAIIVLLFLLFVFKIGTKGCAILTVCGLSCALIFSVIVGYKISFSTQAITDISSDNMQISVPASDPIKEPNPSNEETIAIDSVPTESVESSNENISIDDNIDNSAVDNNADNNNNADINMDANSNSHIDDGSNIDDPSMAEWKARHITALFTCDGYGLLYTSLILMISIAVACFAYRWFKQEQAQHGLFYLILLFTVLGGVTLVYASHLIAFFVGIELLSIPFVGLIGYQYTQTHSLEAAVKYMILSAVASVFLLMGIAFYYATTGELTFSGLSYQLSTMSYPSTLLLIGVCLMLVGIGFKLSLVPFQLWLPDVYQGAPTVIALLLSTVGKVAVFCAIARLFLLAPIVNNETIRIILVIMAFCSILWGNLLALKQSSLKRLLAYSSIAHFGYLFTALIAVQYQVLALETIGVYLIGYILANICILGAISLDSHSNELQDHENEIDLSGLFWRRPILALAMGIGFLSLAGTPLTAGFVGRFLLVLLGVTAELWWLVAAVVIGSALGLYFYARLIINLYIKPPCRDGQMLSGTSIKLKWTDIRISELIIVLCALLTLLCGIYPKWLFNLVSMAQYLTT